MRRNSLRPFYYYERDGVWYYVPIDQITRQKLTAISMRTRDKTIALEKMWRLYLDKCAVTNTDLSGMKDSLKEFILQTFKEGVLSDDYYNRPAPPPIQSHNLGKYADFTLYDYLKLFWTYEISPYIQELQKANKEIPNKERFNKNLKTVEIFKKEFSQIKLSNISVEDINTCLIYFKNKHNWKSATASQRVYTVKQPLHFLSKAGLLKENYVDRMISFSSVNEKKDIFTQSDIKAIFSTPENFASEQMYMINKVLFFTGARIGEILALSPADIFFEKGYCRVHIYKNWCVRGTRIKTTKTCRDDYVCIPLEVGKELQEFINKNVSSCSNFIFSSKLDSNKPVGYSTVLHYFHKMTQKLNISKPRLTLHSYRHTYATMLRDNGFSDEQLLILTRHESSQSLHVYINHQTKAMDKKQMQAIKTIYRLVS